jgi:hypothetical protein
MVMRRMVMAAMMPMTRMMMMMFCGTGMEGSDTKDAEADEEAVSMCD